MLRQSALSVSLVLAAVLAIAPAAVAQDKITGEFDLSWNECWQEPTDAIPDWIGEVAMDGNVYDMVFFNLGNGRPPNQELAEPRGAFIEIWAVYDGLEVTFDEDCLVQTYDGDLVMWGHDAGVSDFGAQEYSMTGTVVEAFGDYAAVAGSDVAMSGTFTLDPETGAPLTAPGTVTIG